MKNDYKYDQFGNLDTDYYVERAYAIRRAYFAQSVKQAKAAFAKWFASLIPARSGHTAH
ncbi:RSP_7527 family protein [Marinomonas mediterranea]|jgi:hypothetical protein|uniref:Uncharacterized protein n=1 Tax=Marinomonas mediterranea (strain ATCC 700492 / JCM 21426 / NBRC 103028 / MMB-1) TaxID=717774 RepID=F2JUE9_MARM1|nr:hypothetical protein [Marinomonas mediterranea]ADZ92768.1 hypothetical protein Marme_3555 [Marinomonas mediterranea MMB-1]WCN10697.1 hypothetical protein GV055_18080 [Marinomonas mediterranea]WCN14754.1 hypothetical protein GV054_17955 [Marinomonas mediterranea]WCN18795.1 hypothetical protein GV053_17985 [Marinomonas mediterranea MMB-1]